MPSSHCIRAAAAVLALALQLSVAAQPAAAQETLEERFTVFLRGAVVGSEAIAVTRDAAGWTIISSGRLNAPLDITLHRLNVRYDTAWKPLEMTLDATIRGQSQGIHTVFSGTTATSEVTIAGVPRSVSIPTSAAALLPNPFFGPFEALTRYLRTAPVGSTMVAFLPPESELSVEVGDSVQETIQTPGRTISAKRTQLTIAPRAAPAPPVNADVWGDEEGRLLRVSISGQALELVREDLASVSTRRVPISRPNDEQVTIPNNGFVLKGTLSRPAGAAPATRLPAVLLVGSNGPSDRDELLFDIPIFGQLADTLADAGFIVLRYDRRGIGQSGGREEAATMIDYADDVRAAVRYLSDRKDVDSKRIAVLGYGDGGAVAMLAAAREKRIASLVLVATVGTTGAELNMEQVKRALDRSNRAEADKQATLERQKKIQQAVITGTGWDELAAYRGQADTPWFQSFLAFDPARVMKDVRQPVLILHGELDTEVAPVHAERLQALANQRKKLPPTEVVKVPRVNHLLATATTGEADEYPSLPNKRISPDVSGPIVRWLQKAPLR
jgi:uncharacterized protein